MPVQDRVRSPGALQVAADVLFVGHADAAEHLHALVAEQEDGVVDARLGDAGDAREVRAVLVDGLQAEREQYGLNGISLLPANLYGPGDNFDLETSHVMPALIRKFHDAKMNNRPTVTVWGTGKPLREFLHVDDCADACLYLMQHYDDEAIVNIGVGSDLSIGDLACLVRDVVGYRGEIVYDTSKPDGTPRKLVDVSRIAGLGWRARIPLEDGVASTYRWFLEHVAGE